MDWTLLIAATLGTSVLVLLVGWLTSLRAQRADVADSFWGIAFVAIVWAAFLVHRGAGARSLLVAGLVSVWGFRLSSYLTLRSAGRDEDRRYRAMREKHGPRFWWVSLFTVFLFQGLLAWIVALPAWLAVATPAPAGVTVFDAVGAFVFLVGFAVETLADAQMARFQSDPANEGEVMDRGLWRASRHPNYFGEAVVWWGIWLVACATPYRWWALAGPILITVLLRRVSGVTLTEKDIAERRPGYVDYVRRTNAFVPWFPRSGSRRSESRSESRS